MPGKFRHRQYKNTSTAYLYSGAKDLLHQYNAYIVVFEAVMESTFCKGAEMFCHGRVNGLNVSMVMAFQHSFKS
jgi:hypothetical protein